MRDRTYDDYVNYTAQMEELSKRNLNQAVIVPHTFEADGWTFTFEASECGDGVWMHVKHGSLSGCLLLSRKNVEELCDAVNEADSEVPR